MNELINAAEERAKLYDGDDRDCIKADVMNAFFAGAEYAQAAANKAAEEGGLQERISQLIFDNTSLGWDKASNLATAVLVFVEADRASRQVANKAEVDLSSLNVQTGADIELVYCNRDDKLRAFPVYATPPATTGASTVLTDERIEESFFVNNDVYGRSSDDSLFGFSDKDGKLIAEFIRLDGYVIIPKEKYYEVAEQAGQVAVPGWISTDDRLPENGKDVIILYWPYDNHENERVAGTAHHVEGTFYDEDGNDMHPPSHWMPFVIPHAAPSPAK